MNSLKAALPLALACLQGCAVASVGASRYLAAGAPDLASYQVARETPLAGAISYETLAVFRPSASGDGGWMAGVGAELSVLAGRPDHPYLIGGVQAGIGTRDQPGTWASWSVGLGYQLLAAGPFGIRGEARYRKLTAERREGLEIGFRVGGGWGRGPARDGGSPIPAPRAPRAVPTGRVPAGAGGAGSVGGTVVGIAAEAMGTPYRWGGTTADGFDCSGLIQFAYGEVGIALPRRSVEQAQAGRAVAPEIWQLEPGDILTFATGAPGVVSHVGLYLGEGRFIHSATGGVQVSVLSATDPYGRWWWQRWLGARRVVP